MTIALLLLLPVAVSLGYVLGAMRSMRRVDELLTRLDRVESHTSPAWRDR